MKRLFDILFSLATLAILSPLYLLLSIAVKSWIGSPIIFRQIRPGLHGRPFEIMKYCTMTDERDGVGNLLADSQRMTRFGSFLRNTSLDELPEVLNVLRGDMSLVGPRPLLMEYLPLYNEKQSRRNEVRPGITGWAQIHGRNALTWQQRFDLDVWYVDNHTFLLDMKIILQTFMKVIKREGINEPGSATMTKFTGNPE